MNRTADSKMTPGGAIPPLDLDLIRSVTQRLLVYPGYVPSLEKLADLLLLLRGLIMLAVPEVEDLALRRPVGDLGRICALERIDQARKQLNARPKDNHHSSQLAYAKALCSMINGLADYYEYFGGAYTVMTRVEEQWQDDGSAFGHMQRVSVPLVATREAYESLLRHCAECKTCRAVHPSGENKNLPCAEAQSLSEAYQEARRARA